MEQQVIPAGKNRLITLLICGLIAGFCMLQAAHAAPAVPTRAGHQYLEVRQSDGSYKPFFVKGINLSVALPGHHPSEFPRDEELYRDWLKMIADMNCNCIRVYTILPPDLYKALRYHNTTYPNQVIWLIQGVWVEPPPNYNYLDKTFMDEVEMNIRRAVDLVHGNADFDERPGWTGGRYTADVSPWLLAWLLGREWEPDDIEGFHELRSDWTSYKGAHISCPQGEPIECWLAQICDYCARHEVDNYNVQHPVAFSNWPPTDPLTHLSETNIEDEADVAGIEAEGRVDIFSSDSVNVSATHMKAEASFPAGIYASYHVYPYWPDFIDNEAKYSAASDSVGPSNFYGYLADLKTIYSDMPLLISEYGLPNGPVTSHQQNQGWHHGGLSEQEVADGMNRLTTGIVDSGCAGGVIFAWIDEWFKKVWLWADMYDPWDDRRLWYNFADAEKNYGMVALLPGEGGPNNTLTGNDEEWADARTLPGTSVTSEPGGPEIASVKVMHDEGFLHMRIELDNFSDWNFDDYGLYLGLDILGEDSFGSDRGNTMWPGPLELESDRGLEEVISFTAGNARLWQTESFRFWEPYRMPYSPLPRIAEVQPHILELESNRWSWFEPVVETNRRRVGRDGTVYEAKSWPVNPLPRGSLRPNKYEDMAIWNISEDNQALEIRIPWILMAFVGPHQMRVLQADEEGKNSSEVSKGLGFSLVMTRSTGEDVCVWPGRDGNVVKTSDSGLYSWPEWGVEDLKYHRRIKPVYYEMQKVYGDIDVP